MAAPLIVSRLPHEARVQPDQAPTACRWCPLSLSVSCLALRLQVEQGIVCLGRAPYLLCTIWIRLPQVSSRTAVVTVPISSGS